MAKVPRPSSLELDWALIVKTISLATLQQDPAYLKHVAGFPLRIDRGYHVLSAIERHSCFERFLQTSAYWVEVLEKGIKAMARARLMALVNSLWCFAQLPDMRLGIIFPRSVVKCLRLWESL